MAGDDPRRLRHPGRAVRGAAPPQAAPRRGDEDRHRRRGRCVPLIDPAAAPLLDREAIEADARDLLDAQLDPWVDKYPDVTVERVVVGGHAAAELTTRSAKAQLVVVGSRGRGPLAGLLFGSVGNALVHRAACPVAVVQAGAGGDHDAS